MTFEQEVLEVVRAHGTKAVWHYTRSRALPSIYEHGFVYSRAELERLGISYESTHYYGAGRHEEVLGRYVSGGPMPPWGMMQHETEEVALLRLHPAVMAISGTCFCPGWSPRGNFDPDKIVTWTGAEHLEELYAGNGPMMINPCEFFVPEKIPVAAIQGVVFFSKASKATVRDAVVAAAAGRDVNLWVNPSRFPRDWQQVGAPWEEEDDAPRL